MLLKNICEIVKECGEIILSAKRDSMEIDSKQGSGNFVTEYDKKVQDALFEKLPEWTREQIMKSTQYQKDHAPVTDVAVDGGNNGGIATASGLAMTRNVGGAPF